MKYFYVYEKDIEKEGQFANVWAPITDKDGKVHKYYWDNVYEIKKGDIVYLSSQNGLVAKGIAITDAYKATHNEIYGIEVPDSKNWSEEGYTTKVDAIFSVEPLLLKPYLSDIMAFNTGRNFPFGLDKKNKEGGYCFQINENFAHYLENIIDSDFIDSGTLEICNEINELQEKKEEENEKISYLIENLKKIDIPSNYQVYVEKGFKGSAGKTNYIASAVTKDQNGKNAEGAIFMREMNNLAKEGKIKLIEQMRCVARDKGLSDGCGYDILSFEMDENGNYVEKYIEVKSTTGDSTVPFEISSNEVKFSKQNAAHYYIYRICNSTSRNPVYFTIKGSVEDNFNLVPTSFKAYKKKTV